jgi:hypothetical protein
LPRPRASKAPRAATLARHLPRPAAVPRALRTFPPRGPAARIQKGRRQCGLEARLTTPLGVSNPPARPCAKVEGEGGRASAAPRRWGKEQAAVLLRCARRGRSRRPGREPGTRSDGSTDHDVEPGEERDADVNTCITGERLPRRNTFTPEHQRHANDRPATTTPSPHREHRGLSLLLSSLNLPSVLRRRRWGAPSSRHAWVPAFVPQNCRVARAWCSRASYAPGPAGATRGPHEPAGLRAGLSVQDRRRRRVAARRALVTRRPRRAIGLGAQVVCVIRASTRGLCRWGIREPSRRDTPAAAASCPATGTTRRPPRAGARVREPGRQAHPSARAEPCVVARGC